VTGRECTRWLECAAKRIISAADMTNILMMTMIMMIIF